ncbi:S24/S26 family peptidase [Cellulosimicrobium cellulans]|uniref:S24/S26 family peptidase n=1 Tax=Cellulosimicrobium cellulans TaxID=1710 RepID=UPI0036ED542E
MTGRAAILVALTSAVAAAAGATLFVRTRLVYVPVDGSSMTPTFQPGDVVVAYRGGRPAVVGDVVVVREPDQTHGWRNLPPLHRGGPAPSGWYIKRVSEPVGHVPADQLYLLSDNVGGIDSRHHGPCPRDQVLGRVVRVASRASGSPTGGRRRP